MVLPAWRNPAQQCYVSLISNDACLTPAESSASVWQAAVVGLGIPYHTATAGCKGGS
jgi:hypothetical protein